MPLAGARLPETGYHPAPGLPSSLLSRRPDLIAAERRLAAGDHRLSEARKRLIPSLRLTAEAGTGSDELRDIFDRNFSVWALAGNLVQPVFAGGRLREGVVIVERETEALLAEFESTLLQAFAEVETLLLQDGSLREEFRLTGRALGEARALDASLESGTRRGIDDILAVLEARRNRLALEARLSELQLLWIENRLALHLALGGGFPVQEPSSNDLSTP